MLFIPHERRREAGFSTEVKPAIHVAAKVAQPLSRIPGEFRGPWPHRMQGLAQDDHQGVCAP